MPARVGPFVLGGSIGQGAMGAVHHAVHAETGARVAVKVARTEAAADPATRLTLTSEIEAVAALDHPHIVRIYDVGVVTAEEAAADADLVPGTPWLAMEFADQGSLKRRLRTLEPAELLELLASLLEALAHAHARGILHLDLKPANVLFSSRTDGPILSDFGMGVVGDPDPNSHFVRGTPHYMAPELVRGHWEELGPWTDLYALGNVAWVIATGEPALTGDSVDDVLQAQVTRDPGAFLPRVDVPDGFEAWCRRLMSKDPDRRFRFAADARAALLALAGSPVPDPIPADWRVAEDGGAAEVNEATGLGLAALREPPVVGRTRERSLLWEALRATHADGLPRVVVVRGPAGSGKSRLARWLGVRAHETGAAAHLWTTHDAEHGLLDALQRAFPVDLRDWDAESGLATRLIGLGVAPEAAGEVAGWLARDRVPGRPGAAHELAWHALRAAAEDRPVVVVCDDVHEPCAATSPETVAFLHGLLARGGRLRAVFVVTAHDEVLCDRPAISASLAALEARPGVVTIELGPLSEQARHALARRLLPLEPSLAAEVAERSAGNPGYAVELLQDLANRRLLRPSRHGLTLPPGVELSAPPALDEAWRGHLDPILAEEPAWAAPLGLAAALGPFVDASRWRAVCETLGVSCPDGLAERLVAERLWKAEPAGWRFLFPAMAEALAPDDPVVHRVVARLLQDPVLVGTAWQRAGDPERALRTWLRATEDAHGAGLAALAARLRVVAAGLRPDDPRRVEVLIADARAALELGHLAEAVERVTALSRAALEPEDRARADELVAAVALLARDGAVLREVVPRLPRSWRRARILRELGSLEDPDGDRPEDHLERARNAFARGIPPASVLQLLPGATGHRLLEARVKSFEGRVRHALGDADGALLAHRAARRRFRALGHVDEHLAHLDLVAALALVEEDEALRLLATVDRDLPPRFRVAAAVVSVMVRLPRPRDLRWTEAFAALTRAIEGDGLFDVEDARRLRYAATRAARPDRRVAVEALVARFLRSPSSAPPEAAPGP